MELSLQIMDDRWALCTPAAPLYDERRIEPFYNATATAAARLNVRIINMSHLSDGQLKIFFYAKESSYEGIFRHALSVAAAFPDAELDVTPLLDAFIDSGLYVRNS